MPDPLELPVGSGSVGVNLPPPVISIVEDDASTLAFMARVLRARGYVVLAYQRADVFTQKHDPDRHGCVVIGGSTPGNQWLALRQTLAEHEHHMPVIVVSARASGNIAVQAMKHGAFDFLAPVSDGALVAAVAEAVGRDRALATVRAQRAILEARLATLTKAEYLVLTRVLAGRLNREIAAESGKAIKTIKHH